MFICSGILFNHESPRRGINFVTNKVVLEAVKIKLGLSDELVLGNLGAMRDWGHAKDYVKGMWLMLQQDQPDDYVLATGESKSVGDLVNYVFDKLDLDSKKYVKTDAKFERAEELHYLRGDSSKARTKLGWEPEYTFETMLDEMIEYWMTLLTKQNNIVWAAY
jgi:GDPmannose 4,6-dehydratase